MHNIGKILASALLWSAGGAGALAAPVYSWNGNGSGTAAYYTFSSGASTCNYGSGSLYGGTTSCLVDNNGVVPAVAGQLVGDQTTLGINVSSSADALGLHAYASVQATGDPYIPGFTGTFYDTNHGGGGTGTATAAQTDTLYPVAPAGWSGGPFDIAFTIQVDGEFSGVLSPGAVTNSYAEGQMAFTISGGAGGDSYNGGNYYQAWSLPSNIEQGVGDDIVNTAITTAPMELTSLSPFFYDFSLEAIAFASCSTTPNLGTCSVTSTAQISNTATVTGIEFEDANGNPIPGFTLLDSNGGTEYDSLITSNSPATPEPGTVWMLATGFVLIGFRFGASGRRRHAASQYDVCDDPIVASGARGRDRGYGRCSR